MDVMLRVRDEREVACQESPMWESEGEAWSEGENASSRDSRMQCVQRYVASSCGLRLMDIGKIMDRERE